MKMTKSLCLATMMAAFIGCGQKETGPKTMRVWGDVSYDGTPLVQGTIEFVPTDDARPAQGQISAGHYDIPATAGPVAEKTYKVTINALAKTGKTVPNIMGDGAPTMDLLYNTIPDEYNGNSTLKAAISPDASKNQFDFKLAKGAVSRPQ